jgi:lipid II:glycine glycyltransferase (peptidoglycan interpeptide bridge formation enzyme)
VTQFQSSPAFDLQIDGQTPDSWTEILAQFDDANFYQTWAYGAVRWGARHLSHFVLRRGGEVVAAAQLRIAKLPLLPAGIAYLRWGPLCQRHGSVLDPTIVRETLTGLVDEYVRRRGLTLQIIPNAYLGDPRGTVYSDAMRLAGLQPNPAVSSYRTIVVSLRESPEVMRKRLDQKWRNQLNGAEKNNLTLEVSSSLDAYREFVSLYDEMWRRKKFETSVDVGEFGRMQSALTGPSRMLIFLVQKDDQAIGALVCSLQGDTAIYLLGATNDRARELKAAYFLHWQAMLWIKKLGAQWYDLGGVDPDANPGGYHFKSGFGGAEVIQLAMHSHPGGWLSGGVAGFVRWLRRKPVVPEKVDRAPGVVA